MVTQLRLMVKRLDFLELMHQKVITMVKNNYVLKIKKQFFVGKLSKIFLIKKINNQKIKCLIETKTDRYKRKLGECFLKDKSLSRILVKNGYAFDYPRYSKKKYSKEQEYAKKNALGLWSMKFKFPWDFRKNNQDFYDTIKKLG
jgi:endonuclease YncB( thermonuclease family)